MTELTGVLDRVLLLAHLVHAEMTRVEREKGLSTARVHLLGVLGATGPSTQQALARALEVTPRNVTGLVDGLVASGHVTREAHPSDRRATLVTATPLGAGAIEGLTALHTHLAERLFGDIPPDRLAVCAVVLDETTQRLARLREEEES